MNQERKTLSLSSPVTTPCRFAKLDEQSTAAGKSWKTNPCVIKREPFGRGSKVVVR